MSFEATLKAHLQYALTALVGERVYPSVRPQLDDAPAVTYRRLSVAEAPSFAGRAATLRHVAAEISCWSRSHSEMLAMVAAVRARMAVQVATLACVLNGTAEGYDPVTKMYRRTLQYSCWYNES